MRKKPRHDDYAADDATEANGATEHEAAVDNPHVNEALADRRSIARYRFGALEGDGSEKSPLSGASRVRSADGHEACTGLSRHARKPSREEMNSQADYLSDEKAKKRVDEC